MNKLAVLSLSAPLLLIGAAYPKLDKAGPIYADGPEPVVEGPAAVSYRPCRPGPGDDHCIQLYERGVRAAYAHWRHDRGPVEVAMGGPEEPMMDGHREMMTDRDHAMMMRRHHEMMMRRHHEAMRCGDEDDADDARGM